MIVAPNPINDLFTLLRALLNPAEIEGGSQNHWLRAPRRPDRARGQVYLLLRGSVSNPTNP